MSAIALGSSAGAHRFRTAQQARATSNIGSGRNRGTQVLTVEDDDVAHLCVDLLRLEDLARVRGGVGADEHLDAIGGRERGGRLDASGGVRTRCAGDG